MADFEQTILVGRLTRDPEMRYTPNGKAVTNFGLAVGDNYTDANGQKVKQTKFFTITAWGKLGENVNQYKKKGEEVMVICTLTADWQDQGDGTKRAFGPRQWTGDDGNTRASWEYTANRVIFMSGGGGGGNSGGYDPTPADDDAADDEIPF